LPQHMIEDRGYVHRISPPPGAIESLKLEWVLAVYYIYMRKFVLFVLAVAGLAFLSEPAAQAGVSFSFGFPVPVPFYYGYYPGYVYYGPYWSNGYYYGRGYYGNGPYGYRYYGRGYYGNGPYAHRYAYHGHR
jgi:hypothetical protein